MNFGKAIEHALAGRRVCRRGWNGKGMWVAWAGPTELVLNVASERMRSFLPGVASVEVRGQFVMFTADGALQPGWLASQADMSADDWLLVTP